MPDFKFLPTFRAPEAKYSGKHFTFRVQRPGQATKKQRFACQLISTRCQYAKVKGSHRCKRRVVLGIGYCPSHLEKVMGVFIADSTLPNAGKGLFAARPFLVGQHIYTEEPPHCSEENTGKACAIPYIGQDLSQADLDRRYGDYTGVYAIDNGGRFIDSACLRGVASFMNHKREGMGANIRFVNYGANNTVCVVVRPVEEGDELFADYGEAYNIDDQTTEYEIKKGKARCAPHDDPECFVD